MWVQKLSLLAVVKLNRPDRRNAWGGRMAVEYRWALHHADTDPSVRVAVLTGEGADFCVGAHLQTLEEIDAYLRRCKEAPLGDIGLFRRELATSRLPWPLRRGLWWFAQNASGPLDRQDGPPSARARRRSMGTDQPQSTDHHRRATPPGPSGGRSR